MGLILTLNGGSSSLKFALFESSVGYPEVGRGRVERLGADPELSFSAYGQTVGKSWPKGDGPADAASAFPVAWAAATEAMAGRDLGAVVHRIVHGGADFTGPVLVDRSVREALGRLSPLAPLHQPVNLAVLDAAARAAPGTPQIACFDTAFHSGGAFVDRAYALPRQFYDGGVRRYGFHGLSFASVLDRMLHGNPDVVRGKLVIAHLGSGCSLAAVEDRKPVATTMGFSPLDGLPMATRCGRIDPGVVLHLMKNGSSIKEVEELLYRKSGLLGLSGISGDVRELEESEAPEAKQALEYFVRRTASEIAAMAAEARGVHALVFTGGVGEHAWRTRGEIVRACEWLGLKLDAEANRRGEGRISTADSPISVLVVRSDEERRMVLEAAQLSADRASVTA